MINGGSHGLTWPTVRAEEMWSQDKWFQKNQVLKKVVQKHSFLKQPGRKSQFFCQVLGQIFGPDFGQTEQQKQQHSLQHQRGAREARARPFIVSVPAVVSVVLFDQNLDQKIVLGWPGSSPGLAQVKP